MKNEDIYDFLKASNHFITMEIDKDLNILKVNNTFSKMLHYHRVKNSLTDYLSFKNSYIIKLEELEEDDFFFLYSLTDKTQYFKCKTFKDDTIKIIGELYNNTPIDVVEEISKIAAKLASVSRELHKKNSQLLQAQDEIIEKDKMILSQSRSNAMSEMLSMLAHQWRQPLNSMSIVLNSILISSEFEEFDLGVKEEALKYQEFVTNEVNKINNSLQKLSKTIDLFSSKLDQDTEVHISLDSIFEDLYDAVHKMLEDKNISIAFDLDTTKKITTIPSVIIQISLIIIQNSIDAFEKLENNKKNIIINTREKDGFLEIKYFDNADVIDKELINKVFDPYFSTKPERNDVGLGLYIAKLLCTKILNGSICIENTKDGVCVTVKISTLQGDEDE